MKPGNLVDPVRRQSGPNRAGCATTRAAATGRHRPEGTGRRLGTAETARGEMPPGLLVPNRRRTLRLSVFHDRPSDRPLGTEHICWLCALSLRSCCHDPY